MVKPVDERRGGNGVDADGDHGGGGAVEARVREALTTVRDPEIPALSIVDLGIVERVAVTDDGVRVDLLPTFAGCPALDVIREDVVAALKAVVGGRAVVVRFVYAPAWTTDRITDTGRAVLFEYGLTPPTGRSPAAGPVRLTVGLRPPASDPVRCPYCGSDQTTLDSAFGPTLCRSVHLCGSCRNVFEAFKRKPPIPAHP
jgi:ring-1,2-phenylacetyl-CoA epoxidase subunit PaaD